MTRTDLGPENDPSVDETAGFPLHMMMWLFGQTSELVSGLMLDCSTASVPCTILGASLGLIWFGQLTSQL